MDPPRYAGVAPEVEGLLYVDDLGQGLVRSLLSVEPPSGSRLVGVRCFISFWSHLGTSSPPSRPWILHWL